MSGGLLTSPAMGRTQVVFHNLLGKLARGRLKPCTPILA